MTEHIDSKYNRVKSAFDAEPLLMKPTSLGLFPRIYNYFGYLPDAGTSYGCYKCTNRAHAGIVTGGFETPHCPQCGLSMDVDNTPLNDGDLDTIQGTGKSFNIIPRCSHCNNELLTNIDFVNNRVDSLHCIACGHDMTPNIINFSDMFSNLNTQRKVNNNMKTDASYEVLSLGKLPQKVKASDVHMTLYDADKQNPFWNVEVQGMPVGRIELKNQSDPQSVQALFVSDRYSEGIAMGMAATGVIPVLKTQNAVIWKAQISEKAYHKKVKATVEASLRKEFETKEAKLTVKASNLTNALIRRIGLVIAGMDKNFYSKLGNPLKSKLYEQMVYAGIYPKTAQRVIEEGFALGATQYFGNVLDKAVDYLKYSEESLAQISEAITDSGIIPPVEIEDDYEEVAGPGEEGLPPIMDEELPPMMGSGVTTTIIENAPADNGFPVVDNGNSYPEPQTMGAHMARASMPLHNVNASPNSGIEAYKQSFSRAGFGRNMSIEKQRVTRVKR